MDKPAFIQFLTYLQYFTQEPYIHLIMFPWSLMYLEKIVQNASFRAWMKQSTSVQECIQLQQQYWQSWTRQQKEEKEEKEEEEEECQS